MKGILLALLVVCLPAFSDTIETVPMSTAISLPNPFPSHPNLAGLSGFFLTREGMEEAVLAMETVPILRSQIRGLEKKGEELAIKLDDSNSRTVAYVVGALIVGGIVGLLIGG